MAMGNWDSLVIDHKGKPNAGYFESKKSGVMVEVYKNWLYIHDKKAWNKNADFTKDTVMQIVSGEVIYKDISINAVRFGRDQVGMYFVISSGFEKTEKGIVGVSHLAGRITPKVISNLKNNIKKQGWRNTLPDFFERVSFRNPKMFNQGIRYFVQHGIDVSKWFKK